MLVLRTAGILLSDPRPSTQQGREMFWWRTKNKNKKYFIGQINLVNIESIEKTTWLKIILLYVSKGGTIAAGI